MPSSSSSTASDSRYRPVQRRLHWSARLDDDDVSAGAGEENGDAFNGGGGDGTFLVAHSSLAAQVAATERRRREEGWNDLGLLETTTHWASPRPAPAATNPASGTTGNEETEAAAT